MSLLSFSQGLNIQKDLITLEQQPDEDVQVQCDVFQLEMENDRTCMNKDSPDGVDLNSHEDMFNVILQKVWV